MEILFNLYFCTLYEKKMAWHIIFNEYFRRAGKCSGRAGIS